MISYDQWTIRPGVALTHITKVYIIIRRALTLLVCFEFIRGILSFQGSLENALKKLLRYACIVRKLQKFLELTEGLISIIQCVFFSSFLAFTMKFYRRARTHRDPTRFQGRPFRMLDSISRRFGSGRTKGYRARQAQQIPVVQNNIISLDSHEVIVFTEDLVTLLTLLSFLEPHLAELDVIEQVLVAGVQSCDNRLENSAKAYKLLEAIYESLVNSLALNEVQQVGLNYWSVYQYHYVSCIFCSLFSLVSYSLSGFAPVDLSSTRWTLGCLTACYEIPTTSLSFARQF